MTATPRAALGLGALFVGGLLGGLLGTVFFARGSVPEGAGATGERVEVQSDPRLLAAIEELTRELRVRAADAPAAGGGAREAVRAGENAPAGDFGALAAALDRLTQALEQARGGAAGGGIGITPLVVPRGGARTEALARLAGRSAEDLAGELRFLTYQQVLDRFGAPTNVTADGWYYTLGAGDAAVTFTFQFRDGFLINVWP